MAAGLVRPSSLQGKSGNDRSGTKCSKGEGGLSRLEKSPSPLISFHRHHSRLALDDAHVAAGLVGAAAEALAGLVGDELSEDYIIPAAFDPRVGPAVAKAVAEAARKSGVARI